jgi:hypothetical protein
MYDIKQKEHKGIIISVLSSTPKKKEQQITLITRILIKNFVPFTIKKTALNSFVKFVLFVVKKMGCWGKNNKKYVVKSSGWNCGDSVLSVFSRVIG